MSHEKVTELPITRQAANESHPHHTAGIRSHCRVSMHHRRNHNVSPQDFIQRVRRFRRDDLLRSIAARTAREATERSPAPYTPVERMSVIREGLWLQIAGICLARSNNHRNRVIEEAALDDLLDGFYNVWPPEIKGQLNDNDWQRVLSRTAYAQMPYQPSPIEPLMRSLCLYGDDARFGDPVLDSDRWQQILGVSLSKLLLIGFAMRAVVAGLGGRLSRSWVLANGSDMFLGSVPADRALDVVDSWLARPVEQLAAAGRATGTPHSGPWGHNPLYEWPMILMDEEAGVGDEYVVPSPTGILQRLSPQGMYFIARNALEADKHPREFEMFTSALGQRYEHYIGEQLRLLRHAQVHPEITYGSSQKGVDFIVETPEVVVLVEAKSVAPNAATRAGVFPDGGDIARNINKACNQIGVTAQLMRQSHPSFPDLGGRPLRGLVVTREQYFNLPFPFIVDEVTPAQVPTTVVSAQQLEHALPALSDDGDCGSALLEALDAEPDRIKMSLAPLPFSANPLLRDVFELWQETEAPATLVTADKPLES